MNKADPISYSVGIVIGALVIGIMWWTSEPNMPPRERTCRSVYIERMALEQCLKHRPTCESVTVEDFTRHYDNKDWEQEHCPDSAGGFLPD